MTLPTSFRAALHCMQVGLLLAGATAHAQAPAAPETAPLSLTVERRVATRAQV